MSLVELLLLTKALMEGAGISRTVFALFLCCCSRLEMVSKLISDSLAS